MDLEPFEKWGMEFIGPIDPSSNQKKYTIVCIDYLTKWDETKVVKVEKFIRENVFYKFGYPKGLVTDQGKNSHLISLIIFREGIR